LRAVLKTPERALAQLFTGKSAVAYGLLSQQPRHALRSVRRGGVRDVVSAAGSRRACRPPPPKPTRATEAGAPVNIRAQRGGLIGVPIDLTGQGDDGRHAARSAGTSASPCRPRSPGLDPDAGQALRIDAVDDHTEDPSGPWQIGQFAELVGLSIPQLRRYDRLQLLEPDGRQAQSGYRYYTHGQTGAARAIALLRSMDMPIADIRRILAGTSDTERRQLFRDHRARLEARLDEVRRLLAAVDTLTQEDTMNVDAGTGLTTWLHVMPRLPVTDLDRSVAYYREALGFRLAWRTADDSLAALASGEIEMLLLVPWTGESPPAAQSAYVYVEDPDTLCAEYQQAGADIVDPVDSRPYGMRDFVVRDPDGHRFTLGRGEEQLREVAGHYGLTPQEISVDPEWLHPRNRS